MYSGEGVEENVSGGEMNGFAWKKEDAIRCVGKKIRRTFASIANVRLHGTITLVCVYCERTFAGVITSVRWFSNVRLRVL